MERAQDKGYIKQTGPEILLLFLKDIVMKDEHERFLKSRAYVEAAIVIVSLAIIFGGIVFCAVTFDNTPPTIEFDDRT